MSTTAEILESVASYGETDQLVALLESFNEARIFSNDNETTVAAISLSNRLLNENSTRRDGLLLLKCLLDQVPRATLQANMLSWVQLTLKGLSQKDSSSTVIVATDVASVLMTLSTKFPENRKEIALTTIGKFFETLYELKDSAQFQKAMLSSLRVIYDHYHKSALPWKEKMETFLLTLLESDEEIVYLASRLFLNLAMSGPPGTDNVNYKDNWAEQFKSITSTLHHVLNKLFVNVNEIKQFVDVGSHSSSPYELSIVNDTPFRRMNRLSLRFVNLCEYLKMMLLGPYPVCKRVKPDLVFNMVCRTLAITVSVLESQVTSDSLALMSQLPRLHSSCLSVLTALIHSCRKNLISYGHLICKLIIQLFKSTEVKKSVYGQHKPYRSVRLGIYNCLNAWLTIAGCSSRVEKHPEIIASLISDIQFKKPTVTLNLSSKTLKGKMGKKQRQALVNQTVSNKEEYVSNNGANKEICVAALKVIPLLLDSSSSLLPATSHKDLQTAVCNELLVIQLSTMDFVPLPYSEKTCRKSLYESFVALCQYPHPSFPPPLSYASQLLSTGLHDPCNEIVQYCGLALTSIDKMLRPIGPTLCYPIELPDAIINQPKPIISVDLGQNDKPPRSSITNTSSTNGTNSTVNGCIAVLLNDEPVSSASESKNNLNTNSQLVDSNIPKFDGLNDHEIGTIKPTNGTTTENPVCVEKPSETKNPVTVHDATETTCNGMNCPINDDHRIKRKSEIQDTLLNKKHKPINSTDGVLEITEVNQATDNLVETMANNSLPNKLTEDQHISSEIIRNIPDDNLEEEMLNSFIDIVDC